MFIHLSRVSGVVMATALLSMPAAASEQSAPMSDGSTVRPIDAIANFLNEQKIAAQRQSELERMIGQMIMVGFHGTSEKSRGAQRVIHMLKRNRIGGVILMQRNVSNRERLLALTKALQSSGSSLPPFISVDQEGGSVQRLRRKQGFSYVPSAGRMASRHNPDEAEKIYGRLASALKTAGVNMNFGPVVDLDRNRNNPIIGRLRRSYGRSVGAVMPYARAFISAHRRAGVMTAAKHFPGHGSSWADSHNRFVDLTKTWKQVELTPYRKLAEYDGPDMVMVGHLYHPRFSNKSSRIPASLSKVAITHELRGRLGFRGIVISDDMEMAAVKRRFSLKERVIRSIAAGTDIILFSDAAKSGTATVDAIHAYIRDAIANGQITMGRIRSAYARIKAAKLRLTPGNPVSASALGLRNGLDPEFVSLKQ